MLTTAIQEIQLTRKSINYYVLAAICWPALVLLETLVICPPLVWWLTLVEISQHPFFSCQSWIWQDWNKMQIILVELCVVFLAKTYDSANIFCSESGWNLAMVYTSWLDNHNPCKVSSESNLQPRIRFDVHLSTQPSYPTSYWKHVKIDQTHGKRIQK